MAGEKEGLRERFVSEGRRFLLDQKIKASETVRDAADGLREAARDMKDSRFHTPASVAGYAADKLTILSETLRDREIDHIMRRATLFTHRHKGSIILGAFILGFSLPKLIKNACEPVELHSDISYPGRLPLEESPPAEILLPADTGAKRYQDTYRTR
jgi:hypothetical protein